MLLPAQSVPTMTRRAALASGLAVGACALTRAATPTIAGSVWRDTLVPCEHNGSGRPGLYPLHDARAGSIQPDASFAARGCYNLITLDPDRVVTVSGVIAESGGRGDAEVVCLDARGLAPLWRTPLPALSTEAWTYPGAVGALRDGRLYVVAGTRLWKLDSETGAVVKHLDLPCPQAARDVAYNGFVALSDGRLLMKSIHRAPGCDVDGFTAFLQCPPARRAASVFAVVDPARMRVDAVWTAPDHVGGRVSTVPSPGGDLAYFVTPGHVHALATSHDGLAPLASWTPAPYRREAERPATAVVPFGDFLVLQTNASPSAEPTRVVVVSQIDPSRTWSLAPFADRADRSFIPSKPSVDVENRRIYAVDGFGGVAALDFEPDRGLSVAWRAEDRSLSFSAITGPAEQRVLIHTAMGDIAGVDRFGWPQYGSESVTWRDAATGDLLGRRDGLPIGPGLNITPGYRGALYYLSFEGVHRLHLPRRRIADAD